jgi:hypothetical protein
VPSDAELEVFYAAHRDDYRQPDRVSFWHVFLASSVHGARTTADAEELLVRVKGLPPAEVVRESDSFAVPPHVVAQSRRDLGKLFGATFAATIQNAGTHTWIGPIPSPYGMHLVWIETRDPGTPPSLAAVRGQVLERWQDEQRRRRVRELLSDLERRYPLHVESAAWRSRSAS